MASMRFAGLLVLAIFFPVLAHAAPPSLTTYTVSHDTMYPGATADSGLATTTSIDTAFSEQVKVSIKIMSAGGTTIKSLYSSSSVTNPTPKIWDGTNTAGARVDNGAYTILISATSTATSLPMIDASKTVTVASSGSSGSSGPDPTPSDTSSDSTTTTTPSSNGGPAEYLPIPTLRIITAGDRIVSTGADTAFSAVVYDGKGNRRDEAFISWSFGDGMQRTGASVFHSYYDPGEYVVVVHATTPDGGDALVESIVTAKDVSIKIASISARGISLINNSSRTLNLSLWRLSMGGKEFKIPADTQILAGRTTLFPSQVIELPIADSASLLYPSGEVAAAYPPASIEQPSPITASYKEVQTKTSPIISTKANIQTYEKAVLAPATVTELAAAGAALTVSSKTSPQASAFGIFKSPWTLSLLGVIALAGGAFVFL